MTEEFRRLIRFKDPHGETHFGEAGDTLGEDLIGKSVPTYDILTPFEKPLRLSGKQAEVEKVRLIIVGCTMKLKLT